MDYHLLFITISIILMIFTIIFYVIDNNKEKTFFGMILSGFNYLLTLINSLGFFSIGIIGYTPDGSIVINTNHEMYSFYVIFFFLHLFCVALIFYGYWLWVRNPKNMNEPKSE